MTREEVNNLKRNDVIIQIGWNGIKHTLVFDSTASDLFVKIRCIECGTPTFCCPKESLISHFTTLVRKSDSEEEIL